MAQEIWRAKMCSGDEVQRYVGREDAKQSAFTTATVKRQCRDATELGSTSISRDLKTKQSLKIQELRHALAAAGFVALDEQAEVLGLSRSTTWAVLKGNHKCSGLSAGVISRMLSSPRLPSSVRRTILEYFDEKAAGSYGHSKGQLRKFVAQLSASVQRTKPLAR